jgi:hypothetical protein
MTSGRPKPPRPVRAAHGLLAALVGVLLVLAAIVVGAVPAAAQNAVGASTLAVINTVGPSAHISAGQRLGRTSPRPQIVVATAVAADTATDGIGSLSRAGDYGIWPYRTLRADINGRGLDAHHLIEQRFAAVMGQKTSDMASIAVTRAEHQVFTNAWRTAIPYGPEGTGMATRLQVEDAARQINSDYPDILKALGL